MLSALCLAVQSSACTPSPSVRPGSSLSSLERQVLVGADDFSAVFSEAERVRLGSGDELVLSIRPLLKAIDGQGQFVVLDKLNVRSIYAFSANGVLTGNIGTEGNLPGQYVYPHTLVYSEADRVYYVYDGDLLQISEYGEDFGFRNAFSVPLYIDQLLVTPKGRMFSYSSGTPTAGPPKTIVFELDDRGQLLNTFAPQSTRYNSWAASEGGGIAFAVQWIYVITPYEYEISVYDLAGKPLLKRTTSSPHYIAPGPHPEPPDGADKLNALRTYHQSWSHIRQLFVLDNRIVCVVFAAPGEDRVFLDLYELDLTPIARDLELPDYSGDILGYGDSLYLITRESTTAGGLPGRPVVVRYRLTPSTGEPIVSEVTLR